MTMTYRELKGFLNQLTKEQLDCDVTIYDVENDEFHPLNGFVGKWNVGVESPADGILDKDHPYFEF